MMYRAMGLGVAGLVLLMLWEIHFTPAVVTFDFKRVRGQFIRQLAEHQINNKDVRAKSQLFHQKIQGVLETYAKQKHVMILERQQVLAGGKDITDALIPLIATSMRGGA